MSKAVIKHNRKDWNSSGPLHDTKGNKPATNRTFRGMATTSGGLGGLKDTVSPRLGAGQKTNLYSRPFAQSARPLGEGMPLQSRLVSCMNQRLTWQRGGRPSCKRVHLPTALCMLCQNMVLLSEVIALAAHYSVSLGVIRFPQEPRAVDHSSCGLQHLLQMMADRNRSLK